MRRRRLLPLIAVLLAACAAPAHAAGAAAAPLIGYVAAPGSRAWPLDARLAQFSPAADSAWRRSPAQGVAFADSLLHLARAQGDRTLEAAVHVWRGRKWADRYELPQGEADLDTAWTLSSALRDSAGLARVLVARAHGHTARGEQADAKRFSQRARVLARASGLPGLVGYADRELGYVAKEEGRYPDARRYLEEAIRLIPADRFENRHARFLLAEVANRTGHHDEARDSFLVLLDVARVRKDRWLRAAAYNDLGNLEYDGGDMASADRNWQFAAAVFDSMADAGSATSSRINRAHALRELGRVEEDQALLDRLLADCRDIANPRIRLGVLSEVANLYRLIGRTSQAESLYRAVRAVPEIDALSEEFTSITLVTLLRENGRAGEAKALIDSVLTPERRARLTRDNMNAALAERAATLRLLGRPREALADAREAERRARTDREVSYFALDIAIELADVHMALGQPDSAVAVLRRTALRWEQWRASISDLEWRERRGSGLAWMFTRYGLALLDPRRGGTASRRAREAFDALQTFQARTLEERLQGRGLAGRGMRRRITLDSLQRGVLREGELLVDLVATPDTTFAFLVTRHSIGVRMLSGASRLERLYAGWRDAALSGAGEDVVAAGLRRLSAELLAPLAEPVRASRQLVVTGGGPIALWPLAALTVPGESGPLGERRDVSTAPSATLLAALRGGGASAPRRFLAIGRTTDAQGRELPGAERELRRLGADFSAEVRENHGDRAVADLVADLPRWNLLHFAAHTQTAAGTPWRSGFLLGRGDGDDAYLRASTVAGMNLRARLAVLSGCQSAGATALAGEGALGLASAFLCSGTTSVVATLWPVEDRVAERFMSAFYAALARGRSVAGAVREAQRSLRARSDTAQVRDWAAFVASGEGSTQIDFKVR